jgi:hypothetical protein
VAAAPAPVVKPAVKPPLPPVLLFTPLLQPPAQSLIPAIPPPPAASFGQTIPPGGATVRVFEDKKEEEEATEQSQAFARFSPAGYGLPLGALILMAAVGASIVRGRRRPRRAALALLSSQTSDPRPRRRI